MSSVRNLVLGGTAFIGRHLVEQLLALGEDVTILNRGASTAPAGVEQLIADRGDPVAMRAVLAGRNWDVVYDVSASVQVASAQSIAELIELLDGHCGLYEFVSSIAAYRFGGGAFPWSEDRQTTRSRPTSYGGHKATVEQLLAERRAKTGFAYTVVRPAAVYGPYDNIPDGEMAMFARLAQRRPVLVPHDGLVCFPYGHVHDLARAMILAARNPAAVGEIFNVTADSVTAMHYIETIAIIMGIEPEIIHVPDTLLAEITGPLPFNHRFQKKLHSILSIDKARHVLGFEPQFDFESGHRQTYEWYLAQGLDQLATPMVDPTWTMTWDFAFETEVINKIRNQCR
ncbi:MAG: NAD-dependent epimerase/dehydratase family protein [Proteobacteria bacterium]|nr:NAD-dependent epimerase/dehydratase family protein [Pseudomonadota bacterium]